MTLQNVVFDQAAHIVVSEQANLLVANFPQCTSIASDAFTLSDIGYALTYLVAPEINFPLCTAIGSTTGDDAVFFLTPPDVPPEEPPVVRDVTITVASSLLTCNGGQPDGDLQYLQSLTDYYNITYVGV